MFIYQKDLQVWLAFSLYSCWIFVVFAIDTVFGIYVIYSQLYLQVVLVISLAEALITVKAFLKALWLCYHNNLFIFIAAMKKIFPNKAQQERKKMKNLYQKIYIVRIINI